MIDKQKAAFDLASKGFKVFPIRENGKLPIQGTSWFGLVCKDEIEAWARWNEPQFRNANVAIRGEGLIIIDADLYKDGAGEALKALRLPPTFTVRTPRGGYHYYFRGPPVANSVGKIGAGIDVRGSQGYVVAPGSEIDGKAYEIVVNQNVADAPQHLIDLCHQAQESKQRESADWASPTAASRIEDGRQYLGSARISIEGSGGSNTLYQVATELWDKGISAQAALDLLLEDGGWNSRCLPPWTPDELVQHINHAFRYAKNEFGCRAVDNIFGEVFIPSEVPPEDDFDLVPVASLSARPLPIRKWYVDGWVPSNSVTLLYGDGGVGKSLAALQLAYAGSTGHDWFGMPVEQGPVIFMSAEDDIDDLHGRMWDIVKPFGKLDNITDLFLLSRAGLDARLAKFDRDDNMLGQPLWAKLVEAVRKHRPKLVVLDNLADIFDGNEIMKNQARAFMNLLRGMCISLDTTILVLAHPSQSGMQSGAGTSGNTAWSNSARSRLYFERDDTKVNGKVDMNRRKMSLMKANYAPAGMQQFVRYNEGRFVVTAPTADVQADRNRALAQLALAHLIETGVSKIPTLDLAKALVSRHVDVTAKFKEASGNYGPVKAYVAEVLAGGISVTDDNGVERTVTIEADSVIYE